MTKGVQDGWTVEQKPLCTPEPFGPLLDTAITAGALAVAVEAGSQQPGGDTAGPRASS